MTCFDRLNTDLLYEIFDYLTFTHLVRAFFNLQKHINDAIQAYPAVIDLSATTDRNAVESNSFACRALIVSGVDSKSHYTNVSHLNFQSIRGIQFHHVEYGILKEFLEQLPLPQLESITIKSLDGQDRSDDIEYDTWSFITTAGQNQLRYFEAPFLIIRSNLEQFVSDLPTLQSATFQYISADEVLVFLQHTPNLCSFTGRIEEWEFDSDLTAVRLFSLTHLHLRMKNCHSFEALHQVLSSCPCLTHFTLQFWITSSNQWMVSAKDWQSLIEQCVPELIYLKIRFFRYIQIESDFDLDDGFSLSKYWLEREPYFDIKYMEV